VVGECGRGFEKVRQFRLDPSALSNGGIQGPAAASYRREPDSAEIRDVLDASLSNVLSNA
jgi:hypothetical protein